LVKQSLNGCLRIGLILFFLGIATTVLPANQFTVSAALDRNEVEVGQQIVLSISLSGGDLSQVPDPIIPDISNHFMVVSSSDQTSFSWINGKVSSAKVRRYMLTPLESGIFTIPPVVVKFRNRSFKTSPLTLTVVQPIAESNPQIPSVSVQAQITPSNSQEQSNESVFLRASVDKTQAVIGEQIIYTLKLFRRVHIWSNISIEAPSLQGFWAEPLDPRGESVQFVNNQKYYVFELMKKAVSPLSAGELIIGEARVGIVIDPFQGKRVLIATSFPITVSPLPDNPPDHYSGAVGDFTVSANIDTSASDLNAPLTLTVTVSGHGNLRRIKSLHFPKTPTFNIYKSIVEDLADGKGPLDQRRSFEYIIVPQKVGNLRIPAFSLSYYSSSEEQFKTLFTPEFPIEVTSVMTDNSFMVAATNLPPHKMDLRYLKTVTSHGTPQYFQLFLGLAAGTNLLVLVWALSACAWKMHLKRDPVRLQKHQAHRIAHKKLRPLSQLRTGQQFSQLSNIFLEFLSSKTGHAFQKLTASEIKSLLRSCGASALHISSVITHLEKLAYVTYAPDQSTPEERDSCYQQTVTLITLLSKDLRC